MKFLGKPVSLGLSLDGRVVKVLKSPGGTWTIIMTSPNGVSCLLIAGKYWQNVVITAKDLKCNPGCGSETTGKRKVLSPFT